MALTKVTYTDYQTVIGADNLNAIQDEIIQKCLTVEQKTFSSDQKAQARTNIGAIDESVASTKADGAKVLVVTSDSFSSLPQTISNEKIALAMVVVNAVLSNPAAQTGDWTVTTASGSLTISGSISGSTSITLYLEKTQV